jgi:ubiquinol-cytochrome c reductase cytochrome b subunit
MSLWAIVVICSLVTAVPFFGEDLLCLIWGGSVVSTTTLMRVFAVHFLVPFIVCGLAVGHLCLLHEVNSKGDSFFLLGSSDRINFYPVLLVRDLCVGGLCLSGFSWSVCFSSDLMGHPDNYMPADPLVTPAEIMPEWYFLPFYAILRGIPFKSSGVLLLCGFLGGVSNVACERSDWWFGAGLLGKSLLVVLLADVVIASQFCIVVNSGESLYWLLLVCVAAVCGL